MSEWKQGAQQWNIESHISWLSWYRSGKGIFFLEHWVWGHEVWELGVCKERYSAKYVLNITLHFIKKKRSLAFLRCISHFQYFTHFVYIASNTYSFSDCFPCSLKKTATPSKQTISQGDTTAGYQTHSQKATFLPNSVFCLWSHIIRTRLPYTSSLFRNPSQFCLYLARICRKFEHERMKHVTREDNLNI
jgi:hypothetical protein